MSSNVNRRFLRSFDPVLWSMISRDEYIYDNSIDMIAGLSIPTKATIEAMSLAQMNRASEGLLRKRFIGTGGEIDEIEELAIDRARKLFGFDHANVQVHSGTQANLAVQQATCRTGDTILSMDLKNGGHLSHGSPYSLSGILFNIVSYGVDPQTNLIDYDEVRRLARKHHPRLLIAGSSSYPRSIDYGIFADIARECGSFLLLDISHPAGFIAAKIFDIPKLPHVIVSFTTEKTLCGPRGGVILCSGNLSGSIDRAVFPCLQSSFSVSSVAGKAAIFHEAESIAYCELQRQIMRNACILAGRFREKGLKLLTDGTDTHMVVVDLSASFGNGKEIEDLLLRVGIMANRQVLPGDKRGPATGSGVRFGTTCLTIRNMPKDCVALLADQIAAIIETGTIEDKVGNTVVDIIAAQTHIPLHSLFRSDIDAV